MMHGSLAPLLHIHARETLLTREPRPWWHWAAIVVFACFNLASVGVFFAVFVGVVIAPPNPRTGLSMLVVGGFAFALLAIGQFVYWSWAALRRFKAPKP